MKSAKIVLIALMASLALMAAGSNVSYKERFVWADETEEIQVLLIRSISDRGIVNMTLLELPFGGKYILYEISDASAGKMRMRLVDDSSSWWIEYADDMHGSFETMDDFFSHIFEFNAPASKTGKKMTSSWRSEIFNFEQTYPFEPEKGGEIRRQFEASALSNKSSIEFARGVPPNAREAIFYLDRFDRQIKYRYEEFTDFLIRLLERAGFESGLEVEEFVFERADYEWGLGTMTTPEELEFTSRFKSIDNADPLAGWRPEDLFPEK